MKIIGKILGAILFGLILPHAAATTFYVNVSNTVPLAPYTNWTTAATNIQDAIDVSTNGDLVLVTNGIYQTGGRVINGSITNRVVINKAVTVQSVNGPSATTILGYQIQSGSTAYSNSVRCVYITNNATLSGFTLSGGSTRAGGSGNIQLRGGGGYCESTNAFLTNCFVIGNSCLGTFPYPSGGGVYLGTLSDCIISNNSVTPYGSSGGGASGSVLNNCLIISNRAPAGAGAISATLNNCSIIGNVVTNFGSTTFGAGIYSCVASNCLVAGNINNASLANGGGADSCTLYNCVLSNNFCALIGGGSSSSSLIGCLVVSNFALRGGGVYNSSATNCTFTGNVATNTGGGAYGGTLNNSIVFGNFCTNTAFLFSSNFYTTTLKNSWISEPVFANPTTGDFHLQSNSPCINAGNNGYVSIATDLDGNPRIVGGTVDIGCYEFQLPSSTLSYAWAQQFNLPTDGSADFTDADGDGLNNWQEWIAGTVPTNAASLLRLNAPTNAAPGLSVGWQSVNTRTYFLQRSTNLPAFTTLQSNLTGQINTTTFTDTSATNGGAYFYRVGVQ